MIKRKFYAIGHNPNTIEEADAFLRAGYNALGPDVSYTDGEYYISHGTLPRAQRESKNLVKYLTGLRELVVVNNYNLALIAFDIKDPVFNINEFTEIVKMHYLSFGVCAKTKIVITTAHIKDVAFVTAYNGNLENVLVGIDEHNNASEAMAALQGIGRTVYANGITGPLTKPNLFYSISEGVYLKAKRQCFKLVYIWVLAAPKSIAAYLHLGVDGIFTDLKDTSILLNILNEPAFDARYELANVTEPELPLNTPTTYLLTIKTRDKLWAGTDAAVRFTLQGANGHIETILEAGFDNIMNRNCINHLVMEGDAIGRIDSLTLELLAKGSAPDWLPEYIHVEAPVGIVARVDYAENEWLTESTPLLTKQLQA